MFSLVSEMSFNNKVRQENQLWWQQPQGYRYYNLPALRVVKICKRIKILWNEVNEYAILNSRLPENEIIIMIRYCHNWRVMESSSIWCVVAALENINQLIILSWRLGVTRQFFSSDLYHLVLTFTNLILHSVPLTSVSVLTLY